MKNDFYRASAQHTERVDSVELSKYRTEFQRDRDRILYSKEFRRLSGKTQVFVAGFDDNMRTRLTHTLEVAQIADTIARSLNLNEILVESIAYGHDVGHTPFGHVGERTLNLIMNGCKDIYQFNKELIDSEKGFKHNLQSLRVISQLETLYNMKGLNLTKYTMWGVLNHSKKKYSKCGYLGEDKKCMLQNRNEKCENNGKFHLGFYDNKILEDSIDWTFEAAVVAIADEIAQRHHDIEDGIYANIINKEELIEKFDSCFKEFYDNSEVDTLNEIKEEKDKSQIIALFSKLIVHLYTSRYIVHLMSVLEELTKRLNIGCNAEFHDKKSIVFDYLCRKHDVLFKSDKCKSKKSAGKTMKLMTVLGFEKDFSRKDKDFKDFLYEKILLSELTQSMDGKSDYIIRQLFKAYLSNPQQLPDNTIERICKNYLEIYSVSENCRNPREFLRKKLHSSCDSVKMQKVVLRTVCDYIAGMTDTYAMSQFEKLYGSQKFKNY